MTVLSRPVLSVGILGTGILLLGWLARPSESTAPLPSPHRGAFHPSAADRPGEPAIELQPRRLARVPPSAGEGRVGTPPSGAASLQKGIELEGRLQSMKREERDLQEKILAAKQKLSGLKDIPGNAAERGVLRAQIKDLEDRHRAAQGLVQGVRGELRSWASESPEHPPAFYRYLAEGGEGPGGERAGTLLAGHFDNPTLESLVLGDLAAEAQERRNLLALQVVEARATPDRVAAVTGLALGSSSEPARLGAVHVLRVYKDDPDALRERAGVFSTLVTLARGAESADVRREALVGLAREKSPSLELMTLVRGVAEKDANESVRAVAAQALKRWEQQ